MRVWMIAVMLSMTAQAFAQAPVEDRRPVRADVSLAQQRLEFTRQALERAEAQVRDALAVQKEAAKRFGEAKAGLDEADKRLAKAKASAAEAKRAYDQQSSEFDRQRRSAP